MRICIILLILVIAKPLATAGIYGDLEFGDSRQTVTQKLRKSSLVTLSVDEAFLGRTGLNGVFKCKARLAGLDYHLYFNWSENDGLNEITLRSNELDMACYRAELHRAWQEADALFARVYGAATQKAPYPASNTFGENSMLITHVWQQPGHSILLGTGVNKGKCFMFIRFVNQRITLQKTH